MIYNMRDKSIDGLKGVAIVAVVLYHFKILPYGYLGVDIFFVISGYLTGLSLERRAAFDRWSYLRFLVDRLKRLMPLVLLATCICLLVGAWGMLPDDYENLSGNVVASDLMSGNIYSYEKIGNYWTSTNDYRPLMHLWYVGVLFEFYMIFPALYYVLDIIQIKGERRARWLAVVIGMLTLGSFLLYFLPIYSAAAKFYLIPFRFFEFGIGSLINYISNKDAMMVCVCAGILSVLVGPEGAGKEQIMVIIAISFTVVYLCSESRIKILLGNGPFVFLGKRSYSLFIWHQILIAFYRYFFSRTPSRLHIVFLLSVLLIISEISFRAIESLASSPHNKTVAIGCLVAFFISFSFGWIVYSNAGVIRDVPEMGVYKSNVIRRKHDVYSDRIYDYDKDYEDNGKIKVFVTGASFGRDFCNALLESEMGNDIDLSYAHTYSSEYRDRVAEADYVFSVGRNDSQISEFYTVGTGKYYGIGSKRYGECNGIIYRKRGEPDYYEQTVEFGNEFWDSIAYEKLDWGDNYIDMMNPVTEPDGRVHVFTDDNMFISQDCYHLTEAGAKYYARVIDWQAIFGDKDRSVSKYD